MENPKLIGAQKVHLRGLGQRMDASIKLGKEGLTSGFLVEMRRQINVHELVKLRFFGVERVNRTAFCLQIEKDVPCEWVGAAGHTALFYRPNPELAVRRVSLPS